MSSPVQQPEAAMPEPGWQVVFESGHWNHSGWTRDSRDGALVCSCGTVLREAEGATS